MSGLGLGVLLVAVCASFVRIPCVLPALLVCRCIIRQLACRLVPISPAVASSCSASTLVHLVLWPCGASLPGRVVPPHLITVYVLTVWAPSALLQALQSSLWCGSHTVMSFTWFQASGWVGASTPTVFLSARAPACGSVS